MAMNATKLAKALLVLFLGLGSVALALHQDNTNTRDEVSALNERLKHLEIVQWNYEVHAALKEKLHRKLIESVDLSRFAQGDASAAGDGQPFVVVVSTSRTCGACLFAQLDQWKQAMAHRGVAHGKLLLVVGDANESLKHQVALKRKVGVVPTAKPSRPSITNTPLSCATIQALSAWGTRAAIAAAYKDALPRQPRLALV